MTGTGTLGREERKVVTALFADLVGSTAIGERLDPEDVHEIVQGAIALAVSAIERFGGTVKDLAGDGVLALFGAPVTHEDDAQRAVLAGLQIVEEIGGYADGVGRRYDLEGFGIRVGIESGLVVLGAVGGGAHVEYGATGDALNTASRIEAAADPGTVLVGGVTHRQVADRFDWDDPRLLDLKGKADPVTAFRALRARPAAPTPAGVPPLVGRDSELTLATRTVDEVIAGGGGVLLVAGEPGIGKSRMLLELRTRLERADGTWLEGRCVSYGEATPFLPFRDLLRSWLGAGADDDDASARDILGERVANIRAGTPEEAAFLASVAGVDGPADRELLAPLSPEAMQFRSMEALESLFVAMADRRPTVVAIEDLHWADPTSLQMTSRLFPLARSHPLLVVVAMRAEPGHGSHAILEQAERSAAGHTTVVRLETLPPGEDRTLLVELVGDQALPNDLADRILDASGGNPLHLEELIRSLIDAGALVRSVGGWQLDHDVEIEIPTSLGKVLVARIDRLEEGCREVLTAASVLGRQFELPLLTRVAERPERVSEDLAELSGLDMVRPMPGSAGYAFKHALIQEAAYGTLLKRRRRELHRRAAAAMEELYAAELDEHAGVLAIHHRGAGQLEAALDCHRRAARSALAVSAQPEALGHLDHALAIAAELGLGDDQAAGLLLERGRTRSRTGDFSGARNDLERAHAAAGSIPTQIAATDELGFLLAGASDYREGLRLLEEALGLAQRSGDEHVLVGIRARISIARTNLLDLSGAFEAASAALEGARREDDEELVAQALDAILLAAVMIGDFERAERVASELADIHRRRGDLWLLQYAVFQSCWGPLAACRFDQASVRIEEAQAIAERIGDRGAEPIYLATLSWLHRSRGAYPRALDAARRGVAAAEGLDHPEWLSWTRAILARTLLDVGAAERAVAELTAAREAADRAGSKIAQLRSIGLLAQAMLHAGEAEAARELSDETLGMLAEIRHPRGRIYIQGAEAPIAVAEVLAELGRGGGERLARKVIRAADAAGWLEMAALAELALGACLELTDIDRATAAFTRALDVATTGGLPGARWRAHARLARVGVDRVRNAEAAAAIVTELRSSISDDSIIDAFGAAVDAELEPKRRGG